VGSAPKVRACLAAAAEGVPRGSYRVDAERYADGLLFRIDDVAQPLADDDMMLVSQALDVRVYKAPVGVGWHTFKWIYYKDISMSAGRDMAEIFEIGYNGTEFAASECQACPPGSTSAKGASRCSSCARDEVWDAEAFRCVGCPAGKYALPGWGTCRARPLCSADDYVAVYSPCSAAGTRDRSFEWMAPKICNSGEGVGLPPPEVGLPCAPCNPGYVRDASAQGSWACVPCDPGSYSPGGSVACKVCPAGTEARLSAFLTEFTAWPRGVTTGCEGECGSNGWRLRTSFLDAGGHDGQAQVWLRVLLVLAEPGQLTFDYDMTCAGEDRRLFLDVNDGPPLLLCGDTPSEPVPAAAGRQGQYQVTLPLPAGRNLVRWVYAQGAGGAVPRPPAVAARIHRVAADGLAAESSEGVAAGGAYECVKCKAGFFAGLAWSGSEFSTQRECQPCPEGETSAPGASGCSPCPSDTFAPQPGSPRCLACGANTHSAPGSNGCNSDCVIDLAGLGFEEAPVGEAAGGDGSIQLPGSAVSEYVFGGWGGGDSGPVLDLRPLRAVLQEMGPLSLPAGDAGLGGLGGLGARALSIALCGSLPRNNSCLAASGGEVGSGGEEEWGVSVCAEPVLADGDDQDVSPQDMARSRAPVSLGAVMSLDVLPAAVLQAVQEQDGASPSEGAGSQGGEETARSGRAGVSLSYESGHVCREGGGGGGESGVEARWQTAIHMVCDLAAGVGSPQPLVLPGLGPTPCAVHLLWRTQHACPLCRHGDYQKLGGNCVKGFQDVVYSRARACFGGVALPANERHVACRAQVVSMLPTGVVVLIAAGLVLLLAGLGSLGYYLLKYRRMYQVLFLIVGGCRCFPPLPSPILSSSCQLSLSRSLVSKNSRGVDVPTDGWDGFAALPHPRQSGCRD